MRLIHLYTGPLDTNTYIAVNGEKAFAVDPAADADVILGIIEREGAKIDAVLLTHGHADHIGAAAALQEAGASVFIHADDAELIGSYKNLAFSLGMSVRKFTPDVILRGGEHIAVAGIKIEVIHTPGHTKGGVCYLAEDVLFAGDTLFFTSYGRTDFPGGDFKQLKNSIVNKLFTLAGDRRVLCGHGEETTLDHERRYNPIKA